MVEVQHAEAFQNDTCTQIVVSLSRAILIVYLAEIAILGFEFRSKYTLFTQPDIIHNQFYIFTKSFIYSQKASLLSCYLDASCISHIEFVALILLIWFLQSVLIAVLSSFLSWKKNAQADRSLFIAITAFVGIYLLLFYNFMSGKVVILGLVINKIDADGFFIIESGLVSFLCAFSLSIFGSNVAVKVKRRLKREALNG